MSELKDAPHGIEVHIISRTGDRKNQDVILEESADSQAELVWKNFRIVDAVVGALRVEMQAMADLAEEGAEPVWGKKPGKGNR